jgi:hypothetical protein
MPHSLPDTISRDDILAAIEAFGGGIAHRFADSTGYDILLEGRRYPPKAIVGIAATAVTGVEYGPEDFSGGRGSKCFRILQRAGFDIVAKAISGLWLFQGNPARFDIEDYLSRYRLLYWSVPRNRDAMRLADRCVLWRSGAEAGAIAVGQIAELPCRKDKVQHPECLGDDLWRQDADSPSDFKVGIEIEEFRLDDEAGYLPRQTFLENPTLANSHIIRAPTGTVFRLDESQAAEFHALWQSSTALSDESSYEAVEGLRRLRQHYARERSRPLIERKRQDFARRHDGRVFCEVCRFDFSVRYPESLGTGFIEVHHLAPLSTREEPRRTGLDDLLLVCANCHRMIHRTRDAEGNLGMLREHFRGDQRANLWLVD